MQKDMAGIVVNLNRLVPDLMDDPIYSPLDSIRYEFIQNHQAIFQNRKISVYLKTKPHKKRKSWN
jgi:hypothetical protein